MFRDRYHIIRIGLFGSYARGDQNVNSDIDLLVEFEDNTQDLYDLKLQLKDFFQKNLGSKLTFAERNISNPESKNRF